MKFQSKCQYSTTATRHNKEGLETMLGLPAFYTGGRLQLVSPSFSTSRYKPDQCHFLLDTSPGLNEAGRHNSPGSKCWSWNAVSKAQESWGSTKGGFLVEHHTSQSRSHTDSRLCFILWPSRTSRLRNIFPTCLQDAKHAFSLKPYVF